MNDRERGRGGGRGCVSEVAAAAGCSHAPTDNNLLKFNALFTADWPQFMAPPQGRVETFACGEGGGNMWREGGCGVVPPLECVQCCAVTCPR